MSQGGETRRPSLSWLTLEERRAVTSASLALGLLLLAAHLALYGITLVGAVAALPWWVNLFSAIVNGLAIGLLFVIGHDSCHGAFLPTKLLNQIVTRLAFIPSAHSASLWNLHHNRVHHVYTNFKGRDNSWVPMTKAEYDAMSPGRRLLERLNRGPFGPLTYYVTGLWLKLLVLPLTEDTKRDWKRYAFDSAFVLVALALTLIGIAALGQWLAPARPVWLTLIQGWLVPFLVWNYFMGLSTYLHHTHPTIPWFDKEESWSFYNAYVRSTTHVDFKVDVLPLWQRLMEHTAHHMLPTIPVYRLHRAQEKLLSRFGKDVVRYTLTGGRFRKIYSVCKLYDFERNCWTDFEGRPTTEPLTIGWDERARDEPAGALPKDAALA
jgi:omega-6 fatty acid desaturase (delta-12 desaturase)